MSAQSLLDYLARDCASSEPEPPPVEAGLAVTPVLLDWLVSNGGDNGHWHEAQQLIRARALFGLRKYGQGLMTDDGRDTIEDARQELGDLLQYVMSARMQGLDLGPIRRLLPVLTKLLAE